MEPATSSTLSLWEPFDLRPQVLSIVVVLLFLVVVSLVYYFKLKKQPVNEAPKGFVLLMQIYISYINNMVVEVLGAKFQKLTPYFIYLFSYILICNTIIGIIGFENPTNSLTVTLSLGLVTWIGTFVIGFRYQKLSYLKHFCLNIKTKKGLKIPIMINPIEIISAITPLISISFRLWGNIFAGSLINLLWFYLFAFVSSKIPIIGTINLLAGLTVPPITMYFDLLCGVIQTLVFVTLTMIYWQQAALLHDEDPYATNKK